MSIGKINEFDLGVKNWSTYIARVEQYFKANKVPDDSKVAVLITVVGDQTYELMENLCDPTKPEDCTYNNLVETMKKHLDPAPSAIAERYKFRARKQEENETIAEYIGALKSLAKKCEFKTALEENLRDQFVYGIRSENIKISLFSEKNLTYQNAINMASTMERAECDSHVMEKMHGGVHHWKREHRGLVGAPRGSGAQTSRRTSRVAGYGYNPEGNRNNGASSSAGNSKNDVTAQRNSCSQIAQTLTVLNPFHKPDVEAARDSDMAGPLVFCLAFGAFLLLSGKVHFSYIYGIGLMGCLSMWVLLSLMSTSGVSLGTVVTVLGYCILPMVGLSGVNVVMSLQGIVGTVLTSIAILWCSLSASKLFVTALSMDHQQPLVMYPCGLLYGVFALLTIF